MRIYILSIKDRAALERFVFDSYDAALEAMERILHERKEYNRLTDEEIERYVNDPVQEQKFHGGFPYADIDEVDCLISNKCLYKITWDILEGDEDEDDYALRELACGLPSIISVPFDGVDQQFVNQLEDIYGWCILSIVPITND
jgi:hypothetical protein